MKIYILRHEERTEDCTFFAPLTEQGLINSKKLVKILNENNINMIYSSPFIRTLQTIYPYSKSTNQLINLEYGLSEIHHSDIIPPKSHGIILPEYLAKKYKYNPDYISLIKSIEIKYPETIDDCEYRLKRIIANIITKYYKCDLNILIVTHQTQCKTMLKIINNFSLEYKNKLNDELLSEYKKGRICLIFDNNWTFKKLN